MRVKRFLLSYFTGFLTSAVGLLIGLISVPLLLKFLGAEKYGAYRASLEVLGHLTILELGFGSALNPVVARALGDSTETELRKVMATGMKTFFIVALATLLAGFALMPFLDNIIGIHPESASDLHIGWSIAVIASLLLPIYPFRVLIEATQQGYWVHLGLLLQQIIITALALALAYFGWGLRGQFFAYVVGNLFFTALIYQRAMRGRQFTLASLFKTSDPGTLRRLRKLNVSALILNVSGRVSFFSDSLITTIFLGPKMVVPLVITQRLAQLAQAQVQGISNASWAAFAQLHSEGKSDIFNQRLLQLTKIISGIACAALIPIAAFNGSFVAKWVGAENYGGDILSWVIALNSVLLAVFGFWNWCVHAVGAIRDLVILSVCTAVVGAAASIYLTSTIGLLGPPLGSLTSLLLVQAWMFPLALKHVFKIRLRSSLAALFAPIIAGLPYGLILYEAAERYPPRSWLALAVSMALSSVVFLSLLWLFALNRSERESFKDIVRRFLGKVTPKT